MKKKLKKLTLHRETLCSLADLQHVVGAATYDKTLCVTQCVTNCPACDATVRTSCC